MDEICIFNSVVGFVGEFDAVVVLVSPWTMSHRKALD